MNECINTYLPFSPTSEEKFAHIRTLLSNLQGHRGFTTLAERYVLVGAVIAWDLIDVGVISAPTTEGIIAVAIADRRSGTDRFISPCEELTSITAEGVKIR